jgi:hypothetical protein
MHRTPDGQTDAAIPPRAGHVAPIRAAERGRPWAWFRRRRAPRLLFLDDDPVRAEAFLRDHRDAVWVTNVPDCLAHLSETWDEVHLDHDLGGKQFVDSRDAESGMEVIRWLCKEPRVHLREVVFLVHTHNVAAGLLMVLHMRASGYKAELRPFGQDLQRLLAHNEPADGDAADRSAARRTSRLRVLAEKWRRRIERLLFHRRLRERM